MWRKVGHHDRHKFFKALIHFTAFLISEGIDGYIGMSIFMFVAIRIGEVDFKNML